MSDKERLIELLERVPLLPPDPDKRQKMLADYLIASGVIVSPISIGDTVYMYLCGGIEPFTITGFSYTKNVGKTLMWFIGRSPRYGEEGFSDDDIGKRVFLTREEAEQALKDGESNG